STAVGLRFGASLMLRGSCFVFIIALSGCGSSRTSRVEGVVLLDGKPLAGASVQFVPRGTGHDATGQTDASGQFVMSTFKPRDGAVPGTYKVVISPPLGAADTTQYATAEAAMSAATKSPPKNEPTTPGFLLQYARPDQTPLEQEVPAKGKVKFELKSK